jgi:hypothetical protein
MLGIDETRRAFAKRKRQVNRFTFVDKICSPMFCQKAARRAHAQSLQEGSLTLEMELQVLFVVKNIFVFGFFFFFLVVLMKIEFAIIFLCVSRRWSVKMPRLLELKHWQLQLVLVVL